MLDFIMEIVKWRLQDKSVNQVSLLVIFVIFQRVDCPEHNIVNTLVLTQCHPNVTPVSL